ncbi:hypothetical protein DL766_004774 [Monosporascus sp. MC13-8B]|uniref:Rhodopsin domain-containing protein n=1 Tax=Monosporascus cannonballus TaxID=155416 RepID=A0ABY0H6L9_9PEZI|nr:hypothetical protein DL762_005229 [Monosporascus cannonballus]RYO96698.1 hypothetical protein DL763_003074 [Monosporascus cannonballus]RYP30678.1 hypothetical protein DL766_004774 [Monosporascus sp. MC13-8B]
MSSAPPVDPGAAAAAAAALQKFVIEDWTLFAVGLCVTVIRTYARVKQFGFKGLQGDDYLVWLAMFFYAIETSLAYAVGAVAKGLANNGMTDDQRLALDPSSSEYKLRVVGSKIQLAGWSTYSALLWSLKLSLLFLYIRLTAGLDRSYNIRIYFGFGFVIVSWIAAMMTLFLGCRPFHKYWQINPDPGDACQPAISSQIVWVYCAMNVVTDLYLISIPVPMLWQSSLKPLKKIGLITLFSGGIFIVVCATLRAALIVTDPVNGAQLAGSWAVRETFVAVITTNLPVAFPLVKAMLAPAFGSLARSMRSSSDKESSGKLSLSFRTFGGGGKQSWRGRGPRTPNPVTGLTITESEERMLSQQGHVKLQNMATSNPNTTADAQDSNGANIRKDVEVAVTSAPADQENPPPQDEGNFSFAGGPRTSHTAYVHK